MLSNEFFGKFRHTSWVTNYFIWTWKHFLSIKFSKKGFELELISFKVHLKPSRKRCRHLATVNSRISRIRLNEKTMSHIFRRPLHHTLESTSNFNCQSSLALRELLQVNLRVGRLRVCHEKVGLSPPDTISCLTLIKRRLFVHRISFRVFFLLH